MKNTQPSRIMVVGALGQIGSNLLRALYDHWGTDSVLAADIRHPEVALPGDFELLDVTNRDALYAHIERYKIDRLYHLAALLSATGERKPELAWEINMQGLLNGLEALRHTRLSRMFWPSSIAVFGPHSPRIHTPQYCTTDPTTVYGISKLAGERWCEYYHHRYGVDVRSLRYPGLIGPEGEPGGGTTDYAVDIFHKALTKGHYTSFLAEDARLPMMYMPDAIRATLDLMRADAANLRIWSSYNVAGLSFTPAELGAAIQARMPSFKLDYEPDFRQAIAASWPATIDDVHARADWGWRPAYDLDAMVDAMLKSLSERYAVSLG